MNKNQQYELLLHTIELMRRLKESNIPFMLYGSLAYSFYVSDDTNHIIGDVDLLVSEQYFTLVESLLSKRIDTNYEVTDQNSITVWVNKHKIEIDSHEFYLKDIHVVPRYEKIAGLHDVALVDIESLITTYKRAVDYIPRKRAAYRRKIRFLEAMLLN